MSDVTAPEHRALAVGYFNAAWVLIDTANRTPEQDRQMLATTCASRQHWQQAGGTDENLVVADWQVAHVASLLGHGNLALAFAHAAADRAQSDGFPLWLKASVEEGLARAHASARDADGYERHAAKARALLAEVDDAEDRELIENQLASIDPPQ
jgi:hypothetical protein